VRHLSGVLGLSLIGLASFVVAQTPTPPKGFLEERAYWDKLEEVYQAGLRTRDFSALKELLEERFADPRETMRDGTLLWLGKHYNELTCDELSELFQIYWRLQPKDSRSDGLRQVLAKCRLERSSRAERASVYWKAIRDGKVDIGGPSPLTWMEALADAVGDGMDEFRPVIEQHAAELNALPERKGVKRSEALLWGLRLRSGAEDAVDARRIAAKRISEMPVAKAAGLMRDDLSFRFEVENLANTVCEVSRPISEPCHDLASTYLKLEQYTQENEQGADTLRNASPEALGNRPGGPPDWLITLRRSTEVATTAIRSERGPRQRQNK
jgi:hypothetical protein